MLVVLMAVAAVAATAVLVRAWRDHRLGRRTPPMVVPGIWTAASWLMWLNVLVGFRGGVRSLGPDVRIPTWLVIAVMVWAGAALLFLILWAATGLGRGDVRVWAPAFGVQSVVAIDQALGAMTRPEQLPFALVAVAGLVVLLLARRRPPTPMSLPTGAAADSGAAAPGVPERPHGR